MANIQFTAKEQAFIKNIMKPFGNINPAVQNDFLEHVLNQRLGGIMPDNVKEIIESIVCKLVMARADIEIEKMLTDPTYGEVAFENTKAASYGSVKNLSGKHQALLTALRLNPEVNRRELASILGWPINSVTPRVCELIEAKMIRVSGVKRDEETNQKTELLVAI